MSRKGTVAALILMLAALRTARAEVIDLSAQSDAYFSNPLKADRVAATLRGRSCADAVFSVTIESNGVRLFERTIPVARILSCEWFRRAPDEARWAAIHLVNSAIAPLRASDRHCSPSRAIGCVASPVLERLQRANVPLLCFATGSESSSCVSFDPEAKAVVEVWRYSE